MSTMRATTKIRGSRPYLFHNFGRDSIPLGREAKTGKAGNDPDEWRKTVCVTTDGRLFIKSSQIFATLRDGAKFTRKSRGNVQKDVIAVLTVDTPEEIVLDRRLPERLTEDKREPVYLDIRGVRNPSTGAANVRYRVALSPGWELEFALLWDDTIINESTMHAVLIDAGRMCGLGNGRNIGMGRFEVLAFEAAALKAKA